MNTTQVSEKMNHLVECGEDCDELQDAQKAGDEKDAVVREDFAPVHLY